jgi:hypothetical protein
MKEQGVIDRFKAWGKQQIDNPVGTAELINSFVNKYVVSPLLNFGIAGIVFDRPKEDEISLRKTITTHYVEDNSPINTHIAREPIKLTFTGEVMQVVYETPSVKDSLQNLAEKLTIFNGLLPSITETTRKILEGLEEGKRTASSFLDNSLLTSMNIYQLIKQLNPGATRQSQFFNYIKAISDANIRIGMNTPFGYIPEMIIENINGRESEDSRFQANFEISFVEWRQISIRDVDFDPSKWKNRALAAETPVEGLGKIQGKKVNKSLAIQGFEALLKLYGGQ